MKKKLLLIIPIILFILGVSYAFFSYFRVGESNNEIVAGQIYMKYTDSNTLYLTNIFPETREKALKEGRTDNEIRFSIKGKNEYTKEDIYYEINLNLGDEIEGRKRIRPEDVMIYLECDGEVLVDGMTFKEWDETRIWVHTIPANTLNETTKNYVLKAWVREDVLISDTNPNAEYTADDWNLSYISLKLSVYGDFVEKESPFSLMANIKNNLSSNLTTQDTDCNQYVYGQVENNYVWYSGKLWRIVSINNCDGTIKLVTQGNMTSVAWNTTSSTDYSTSQIRNWLKTEFLPTLENRDKLLADSVWDYTTYSSANATKNPPTDTVPDKVGLLTIYDFRKTGGTTSSSTTNTFLNNDYYWWLMTPRTSGSRVWSVNYSGDASYTSPTDGYGARPSVNLKSGIIISGGTGEKSKPYTIEGDKATGTVYELLSNRISGEYIIFNNTRYRIVGVENDLTKVAMVGYITSIKFAESSNDAYNTSTGIGKYLLDWYNGTLISNTYKDMIATDGIEWYIGPDDGIGYDYTLSKTGTVVATPIGLGYYGEMFSSHSDDHISNNSIWLMSRYNVDNSQYWTVDAWGRAKPIQSFTNERDVRPSFYLKADVKITGGTGQPGTPYEISQ